MASRDTAVPRFWISAGFLFFLSITAFAQDPCNKDLPKLVPADHEQILQTLEDVLQKAQIYTEAASASGKDDATYYLGPLERVGSGGQGTVYRTSPKRGPVVAVKVGSAKTLLLDQFFSRVLFNAFSRTAAQQNDYEAFNPFLTKRFGKDGHGVFLRMALAEKTLDPNDFGPNNLEAAAMRIREAAAIIAFAHDQQIVLRDVKPHNFVIMPNGKLAIIDLGSASFVGMKAQDEGVGGTYGFMTESQMNDKLPEPAMDIHALQVSAITLCAGAPLNSQRLRTLGLTRTRSRTTRNGRRDYSKIVKSLYSVSTATPPEVSAALRQPVKTVREFQQLFDRAMEAHRTGTTSDFFKNTFTPLFEKSIHRDPAEAANRWLTSVELTDAVERGEIVLTDEAKTKLYRAAGKIYEYFWKSNPDSRSHTADEPIANPELQRKILEWNRPWNRFIRVVRKKIKGTDGSDTPVDLGHR